MKMISQSYGISILYTMTCNNVMVNDCQTILAASQIIMNKIFRIIFNIDRFTYQLSIVGRKVSESSSGVFPPHFLPTNTMTIEISVGKVLARKGHEAGLAIVIPTGSYKLHI